MTIRLLNQQTYPQWVPLWLLLSLFLSPLACSRAPETPAEIAQAIVKKTELLFQSQGTDYDAHPLLGILLGLHQRLQALKAEAFAAENLEEVKIIEIETLKLKSFLGLILTYAYRGGRRISKPKPGQAPEDIKSSRIVLSSTMAKMTFLEHEGNILSMDDIRDYYQELQQAIPDYSFAYSTYASFLLLYGSWDEAIRLSEEARRHNPYDFFALRTLIVALFARQGHKDDIEIYARDYKKVLKDNVTVDHFLSRTAERYNDLETAIQYAEKSISKIRSVQLIMRLANLYEKTGNLKKARYHYSSLLGVSKFAGKGVYREAEGHVERIAQLMEEEKRKKRESRKKNT